eukprot:564810_1
MTRRKSNHLQFYLCRFWIALIIEMIIVLFAITIYFRMFAWDDVMGGVYHSMVNITQHQMVINVSRHDSGKPLHFRPRTFRKHKGIIFDTNHKLLYCHIPKNACTIFSNLMYAMIRNQTNEPKTMYDPDTIYAKIFKSIIPDTDTNLKIQTQQGNVWFINEYNSDLYTQMLKDKTWNKFIIVRDPLERILSGYLDKCMRYKDNIRRQETWCLYKKQRNETYSFHKFIHVLVNKIMDDDTISDHYRPQSSFCGLTDEPDVVDLYYDRIIYYHLDTIAEQTLRYLKSIHLEHLYYYNWGEQNTALFGIHTNHTTVDQETSEIAFYSTYYDKELANICLKAFGSDYKMFNIPKPEWVQYLPNKGSS